MGDPKSRMIPLLGTVYCLVAIVGLYVAVLGQMTKPAPLPLIDETGKQSVRLEQARRIMEQAQRQQPGNAILTMFYKGWLLESDYEDLAEYTKPKYEGDSLERRLNSYNRTVTAIDYIYQDAVYALALLSSGSLILIMLMLWSPGYLVSVLLAAYPVVVVLACAWLHINSDPLEWCWGPFIALGGLIFVFQLVFAFRFGRPEHRTVEGLPWLMIYRRGLVMTNLGIFFLVGALLMATGSLSGAGRSARTSLGLMLFGEGGVALIGFLLALVLIGPGVRAMCRKPSGKVA
jgi:hypothetical protein